MIIGCTSLLPLSPLLLPFIPPFLSLPPSPPPSLSLPLSLPPSFPSLPPAHENVLKQHERARKLHWTLHGWASVHHAGLHLSVTTVQMIILLFFNSTEVYRYMRISKNHNSLGCEQPLDLDVNQSPVVQDAFRPMPGLISCASHVHVHCIYVMCTEPYCDVNGHCLYTHSS